MIDSYFLELCERCARIRPALEAFRSALDEVREAVSAFSAALANLGSVTEAQKRGMSKVLTELAEAEAACHGDRKPLLAALDGFRRRRASEVPGDNKGQHAARKAFDSMPNRLRGL